MFALKITSLVSQENRHWKINQTGIDFPSTSITPSPLVTLEGVASISDPAGNYLMCTNGVTVWDRSNNIMPNGNGLLGGTSSTQSSIIVQQPLSNRYYYIFTVAQDAGINGVRYSVVDMTLNGGFGDIISTQKNIPLSPWAMSEKLTAVRHCNNRDVWIVTKGWMTSSFESWLLTPTGITTLSASLAGYIPSGATQSSYGQLKANSTGNKLAACYYGLANGSGANRVELYDFNNATGVVSNAVLLANIPTVYGCEFSPSGRFLYTSTNQGLLSQFDLCNNNQRTNIINVGPFFGSLQTALDGKIYIARGNKSILSRINNPDVVGLGCNYQDTAIVLTNSSRMGLPNFAPYYINNTIIETSYIGCGTIQFNTPLTCTLQNATYLWDFGDGTTSNQQNPIHQYSYGTYVATLSINSNCYSDTQSISIIYPSITTIVITP